MPVAGAVDYVAGDGTVDDARAAAGYVENQGDGWTYTVDYLERFLEQYRAGTVASRRRPEDCMAPIWR